MRRDASLRQVVSLFQRVLLRLSKVGDKKKHTSLLKNAQNSAQSLSMQDCAAFEKKAKSTRQQRSQSDRDSRFEIRFKRDADFIDQRWWTGGDDAERVLGPSARSFRHLYEHPAVQKTFALEAFVFVLIRDKVAFEHGKGHYERFATLLSFSENLVL